MSESKTEQFVRLLMSAEQDLYAYTFSLLPHVEDARDVMQEAAVTMWQHFDEYDAERPFFPWASRFAYFGVLTARKRRQRARKHLSDRSIEMLADEFRQHQPEFSARLKVLSQCLDKMPAPARRLLGQRYEEGRTIQEIARTSRRSVNTLYKAFQKIRHWLLACVEQALAREGGK